MLHVVRHIELFILFFITFYLFSQRKIIVKAESYAEPQVCRMLHIPANKSCHSSLMSSFNNA